jgi:CheY-like chemotaxis protein/anti-sigma regulatory factor (Ser/Thr protein kinase)
LDISKIEAGKLELVLNAYDIPSLLNDTITQSILHLGEKAVTFSLDIDETLPTRLHGDELRIKQIFNNLLSNAFKYTREGTVELSVRGVREDDVVWMTARVRDTGIGIRPEDMDKLFADYTQFDAQINRGIRGTGLGLPIVKSLVEVMGGAITVESEYGKGSVFTVRFPQQFVTDAVIGPEVVTSLKRFHYSDRKRSRDSHLARIRLPYARVLVVDDVVTNLDVAKGMLKPYGMQVDCVTSGRQAIDAIRAEKVHYNAVFMDHMMPGMDGVTATRLIREEIGSEYARTVPIIALTANAIAGNEKMFLSEGFQAFIPKPIEIARLDAVIRQWVRNKELEDPGVDRQVDAEGRMVPEVRSGQGGRAAADRRSGSDWRARGEKIAGLHVRKGLERFGGDEEAYLQALRSYAANTRSLLEAAGGVTRENLADYAIRVHGIKGSSRSICADMAGDRAEALEKAAKEGDIDFVIDNNAAFIEAVEKLVGELDDMLQRRYLEKPKPKKVQPDKDALDRLLAACAEYDMDGVDAAMAELEGYEYESDNGLVPWLRKNVDQMNFTHIKEKLSASAK